MVWRAKARGSGGGELTLRHVVAVRVELSDAVETSTLESLLRREGPDLRGTHPLERG